MKLRVIDWEIVQSRLPDTQEGKALHAYIEHRTFGKLYQSKVAIGLQEKYEALVREAMKGTDEREEIHPAT